MKITIITPSYNQAPYLEATILSVLAQNYQDLEFIIIDGGSTDGSVEIIKKYEPFLSYWVSEPDSGQSEAINKGITKATGEIITWINSDDLLLPNALQAVKEEFTQQGAETGVVFGGAVLFDETKELQTFYFTSNPCPEAYVAGMIFAQPASFFRRCLLERIGFLSEQLHYGMDYDLFARLSLLTRFHFVPQIFAKYRLHHQSKTVTEFSRFVEDWKKIFVNVCKNLNWVEELEFLASFGTYQDALAYDSPFTFSCEIALDPRLALYHHLCFMLYNSTEFEAENSTEMEILKKFDTCFPTFLLKTKAGNQYNSILSPLHQCLFQHTADTAYTNV
jgi:glycosyltransferase involved in cell wall biosynthesis